ncbi:MAG: malate synthase A [Chloroflexota bacterium]
MTTKSGIDCAHTVETAGILSPHALDFVAKLERAFGQRRRDLLAARAVRQVEIDNGSLPAFLPETAAIRSGDWQVAPVPLHLQKRWVEITGPTDRKMVINALNCGADVFMADFEDANSPSWSNMVEGQRNLRRAIRNEIDFKAPNGKEYKLNSDHAILFVRPRGLHLEEEHVQVEGRSISASLFDFGIYFFHNAKRLIENGFGPYFYLPKLESHLEARWWNDVFNMAQDELRIPRGTIKATVLIETIMAAYEMDEILYELRKHSAGLNAGRWDYIFSVIKKFRNQPSFLLPDRAQIGMTVPFMHAYTELLVKTCHKRGAHAMGGMSAFIPNRKDPAVTQAAMEKVRNDKWREAKAGHDGTWVAHPDLVPMVTRIFEDALVHKPNQIKMQRDDVNITAEDLRNFEIEGGKITNKGLCTNINVAILYMNAWLQGNGAAALYNLMEDTATAEISRAQLWNWIRHPDAVLADGRPITLGLCRTVIGQELDAIRDQIGDDAFESGQYELGAKLLDELISDDSFIDFLTLTGYSHLC